MKKILTLVSIAALLSGSLMVSAQSDNLMTQRKSALENLEVYKSTITDTTLDVMKELSKVQDLVIAADKPIIEIYLDSVKTKADSLKRTAGNLANDKDVLEKEAKAKNDLFLYGIIGAGVIFLLFVVFLILFFITSGKKNKLKKQVEGIEKIKQDNQKEIERAKKEVETLKINAQKDAETLKLNAQKEIAVAKENVDKEVKNLQAMINSQNAEKAALERRISEKINECTELTTQISMLKTDSEKKLKEASTSVDFTREKLVLEKEIFDKGLIIDNLTKEKETIKQDLADYKDLYEKQTNERKALEEKIVEIEKEIRGISPVDPSEVNWLIKEKENLSKEIESYKETCEKLTSEKKIVEERLAAKEDELRNIPIPDANETSEMKKEIEKYKEDMLRLNEKLDREVKTKNMIEDELRRFIDELRNI